MRLRYIKNTDYFLSFTDISRPGLLHLLRNKQKIAVTRCECDSLTKQRHNPPGRDSHSDASNGRRFVSPGWRKQNE